MTLRKRKGSAFWQIEFEHQGQRYRRSTGTTDKELAQQMHDRLRAQVVALSRRAKPDPRSARRAADAVRRPQQQQQPGRYLEPEEVELLIAAAPPHLRGLIVFLSETGARLGEALELRWGDVQLDHEERPTVTLGRRLQSRPRGGHRPRYRSVPLTPGVRDLMQAMRAARAGEGAAGPDDPVWCYRDPAGHLQPLKDPTTAWRNTRSRAGLDWKPRLIDLRHYAASRWVRAGIGLWTVAILLGHRTPTTAARQYAHLAPDAVDQW